MLTALDVANYILGEAKKEGIDITPMKLQKLIYILYKEYLKATRKKLFDDVFLVWQYGPVIESVYRAFRKYKANPIQEFYSEEEGKYTTVEPTDTFKRIFDRVWDRHKNQTGIHLSNLTHQENTAWSKAYKEKLSVIEIRDIFEEATYEI